MDRRRHYSLIQVDRLEHLSQLIYGRIRLVYASIEGQIGASRCCGHHTSLEILSVLVVYTGTGFVDRNVAIGATVKNPAAVFLVFETGTRALIIVVIPYRNIVLVTGAG